MLWPTLIVDNFFTDPQAIVKLSKTLKYKRAIDNKWPGTRSPSLHEVDKEFFLWSTRKIMSILYPMDRDVIKWEALQYFQRVPYKIYGEEGWVHNDSGQEFTSIIYLSDHFQSGTCLYEGTHFNTAVEYEEEKRRFFRDLTDRKRMKKYRDKSNSKFHKKVELFSNFNRLVLFDSHNWHASRNSGGDKNDRLTLITFFSNIRCENICYPIPTMRRI